VLQSAAARPHRQSPTPLRVLASDSIALRATALGTFVSVVASFVSMLPALSVGAFVSWIVLGTFVVAGIAGSTLRLLAQRRIAGTSSWNPIAALGFLKKPQQIQAL
jgi:hypothetical protein